MKRRSAIKNVLFFSAGAVLLPACMHTDTRASIVLKNIQVTGLQEKLLAELAETILPTTATPGARQLASQQFILMMVDDCFAKDAQGKFMKGLNGFDDFTNKRIGERFVNASAAKRAELLKAIESKKDIPDEIGSFYNTAKRLTIQSFTGSRFYLTRVRKYEMVPGRFHGCFPVASKS